jgi:hypothetical protein
MGGFKEKTRGTFFPGNQEKLNKIINIDDHLSDEDDSALDRYEVNMDQGQFSKKRYKRVYDSKYKFPSASKLKQAIANG